MNAEVARGRAAHRAGLWADAYDLLHRCDGREDLGPDDLEILAEAAHFTGRLEESVEVRTRVYRAHQARGAASAAAMTAYRNCLVLLLRGSVAEANGWLTRARHLLEPEPEGAVHGYVSTAEAEMCYFAGDPVRSLAAAKRAVELGRRCAEGDLLNIGRHQVGRALVALDEIASGMDELDEAMLAAIGGELEAYAGVWIYCSSIYVCDDLGDVDRASQWTAAFQRWVSGRRQAGVWSGSCRAHRSRILRRQGDWADAEREARRACVEGCETVAWDTANAWYQIGEIRRLVGDLSAAEDAYARAVGYGWDAQPGFSLLRAAQGDYRSAGAGLRRALAENPANRAERVRLLPALVEIAIGGGDLEGARTAVGELSLLAQGRERAIRASAAQCAGALHLAENDVPAALPPLREAGRLWAELDFPYENARVLHLLGVACRMAGDDDAARLHWRSAREVFARLGATPDVKEIDNLLGGARPQPLPAGLSPREAEVLRLVAAGLTNHAVAQALSLSEKTVARHVSNIFTKIGVSTRAAATAYACRHGLD
ncbi:helix-turn-helix transcriptional regulator [Nocardia huaxiensis]|uniref:LuxR family transcriptional regulator n=1 Tax=Nocardia huaxiensis TaxID=2755382 RepID=A0A7D6V907_9NOCA|nr:helix-turn-helix transcriptional regulator [Nocardia huaxiensis]QLY29333.1 LuxR family transcriptional regulator [Nocardia huaxiensis]UFS97190.1 response regulator transcription factor [Nocardia huaxiensis]